MDADKIKALATRVAALHRRLRAIKQTKPSHPIQTETDLDIQNELTALELELRVTPKDETDKTLFLKLCGDIQSTIVDYVTLKETLAEVQVVPSPKTISNLSEVIRLERQEEIIALEKDLLQLKEIVIDVNELVNDQIQPLREVEQQVEVTSSETLKTEAELEKASVYQSQWRKKWCCLVLIACAVLILGVGIVVFGVLVL